MAKAGARSGDSPAKEHTDMPMSIETAIKTAMGIDGAIGVAIVDYTSGMALGTASTSKQLDPSVAAAGNTEVLRAKMRTMEMLKLTDSVEDILITLGKQYHILRPLTGRSGTGLFIYLAMDKARGNLAMARHQLRTVAEDLEV
jgi:hypothetical protein